MGIDHLTADILAEARKEAKAITSAAEAEKKAYLAEEKQRVSNRRNAAKAEADAFVFAQQRERIAWAKLEAKKIEGDARESVITNTMTELYKQLLTLRGTSGYSKFINQRVKEALEELSVSNPVVHVYKGDKKLLKGVTATIKEDLPGMGGAIIESSDGSVRVDATLETLFEDKRELLRKMLYERMFR